jgi:YjbE family integral membrane protein
MFDWLGPLGGIILIDLVLSGDNALVIGAAAAGLNKRDRLWAIIGGGGGAIVLRILFTIIATYLLLLPYLQAIGGLILIYIAIRLLWDRSKEARHVANSHAHPEVKKRNGFMSALLTILIADVTMSLDNVLAVGAIAHGAVWLVVLGLILSIVLLLVGSAIVATLIKWLPWLLDLASLVLGHTAAEMLIHDERLAPLLNQLPFAGVKVGAFGINFSTNILVTVSAMLLILLVDLYLIWGDRKALAKGTASKETVNK